ncbi:putative reverse transcriptase domain-containing protein [Tanacetum coccineum]
MNVHDLAILDDAIPLKEKDPGSFTIPCNINNICFEKGLADLGSSVSVMPYSTFTNLGLGELAPTKLIIELADRTIIRSNGIVENLLVGIDKFVFPVDFIVLDMPEDIKVPLILERPFLSTAHAKIDMFKRKITLRVARLIGEGLILNRSLDPVYGDCIELNDLNEPCELMRNQEVDNLGPTAEEGEVIDKPMKDIVNTRYDDKNIEGIDEYLSFGHVNANFFPILLMNVMSKKLYNSIMKDKIQYKGKNVVGAFMNVSIFVGNFCVVTDFVVVENMDAYRDKDMGDVIIGKPFYKASCVEARRFDGYITIHDGNNNVTYQMARSHPWFKHLTNAQCNKIWPLLKVSARDKLEGISHPYQKLKGFYKGVLNLGPEYIRDAKTVEWLTRGHVSMHEIKLSIQRIQLNGYGVSNSMDTAY